MMIVRMPKTGTSAFEFIRSTGVIKLVKNVKSVKLIKSVQIFRAVKVVGVISSMNHPDSQGMVRSIRH